jgi:hypothetical protein
MSYIIIKNPTIFTSDLLKFNKTTLEYDNKELYLQTTKFNVIAKKDNKLIVSFSNDDFISCVLSVDDIFCRSYSNNFERSMFQCTLKTNWSDNKRKRNIMIIDYSDSTQFYNDMGELMHIDDITNFVNVCGYAIIKPLKLNIKHHSIVWTIHQIKLMITDQEFNECMLFDKTTDQVDPVDQEYFESI